MQIFFVGVWSSQLDLTILHTSPPCIRNLHRTVRRVQSQQRKERASIIPPDKVHRVVREVVRKIAVALSQFIILFEHRAEVMTPNGRR